MKPDPLYALLIQIPDQKAIVNEVCFKSCGKILVGGVDLGPEGGAAFVCAVPATECPALMKELDEPMGDVDGRPVFLRRLQKPTTRPTP